MCVEIVEIFDKALSDLCRKFRRRRVHPERDDVRLIIYVDRQKLVESLNAIVQAVSLIVAVDSQDSHERDRINRSFCRAGIEVAGQQNALQQLATAEYPGVKVRRLTWFGAQREPDLTRKASEPTRKLGRRRCLRHETRFGRVP